MIKIFMQNHEEEDIFNFCIGENIPYKKFITWLKLCYISFNQWQEISIMSCSLLFINSATLRVLASIRRSKSCWSMLSQFLLIATLISLRFAGGGCSCSYSCSMGLNSSKPSKYYLVLFRSALQFPWNQFLLHVGPQ